MFENDVERRCVICGDPIGPREDADGHVYESFETRHVPEHLRPALQTLDAELSKAGVLISLPVCWTSEGTVVLKFADVEDCEKLLNIVSEPDEKPASLYNCIRHYSAEKDYWHFDFEYDDLGAVFDDDDNEKPSELSPDFHAYPYVMFPDRHLSKVIERLEVYNRASEKKTR